MIQPLGKSVLIPSLFTAIEESAAETGIQNKDLGWKTETLLIREDFDFLIKSTIEIIENEAKQYKGRFSCILIFTLASFLLGTTFAGNNNILSK